MMFKKILRQLLLLLLLFGNTLGGHQLFFEEAGARFHIDPKVLLSIAKVESNFNPTAINYNKNGTMDIGIMQINTVHLPLLARLGISQTDLFNPRININFGAYVLAKCLDKHGVTINGINCYNGKLSNNPYALRVLNQIIKNGYN